MLQKIITGSRAHTHDTVTRTVHSAQWSVHRQTHTHTSQDTTPKHGSKTKRAQHTYVTYYDYSTSYDVDST